MYSDTYDLNLSFLRNINADEKLVGRVLPIMIKEGLDKSIFLELFQLISDYTNRGFSLQDALFIYRGIHRLSEKSLFNDLIEKTKSDNRFNESFFDNYVNSNQLHTSTAKSINKSRYFFESNGLQSQHALLLEEVMYISDPNLVFLRSIHADENLVQRVLPVMNENNINANSFKLNFKLISDYTKIGFLLQDALFIYRGLDDNLTKNSIFTYLVDKSNRLDEYFFDNFIGSELKYITIVKATDKSREYFELKGLRPEYADILEELVSSAESRKIYSRHPTTGNSPMQYGGNGNLPEISDRELYFLVNHYSKKRKECTGSCLLKSRPEVVLTGTHAGKLLPNINPFRLLNGEMIEKYSLDVEQLVKVGDLLLEYTLDSMKQCLELLLSEYYEKSQLKSLLYADCLIGFYTWGLINPLLYNWDNVHPLHSMKNYGWIFFDMIMNFSHLIFMLKKKITVEKNDMIVVANVEKLEHEMKKFLNYKEDASDGYMSNYYQFSANCILSTLLEACILQESGVPNYEIFLRLEINPSGDMTPKDETEMHFFSNLNPKSKGNFKSAHSAHPAHSAHWTARYGNKKFRSMYELCTDKEINFGEHKLEVAMAILYPIFGRSYMLIKQNAIRVIDGIFEEIDINNDLVGESEELIKKIQTKSHEAKALTIDRLKEILYLEYYVKYILENKIPSLYIKSEIELEMEVQMQAEECEKISENAMGKFNILHEFILRLMRNNE